MSHSPHLPGSGGGAPTAGRAAPITAAGSSSLYPTPPGGHPALNPLPFPYHGMYPHAGMNPADLWKAYPHLQASPASSAAAAVAARQLLNPGSAAVLAAEQQFKQQQQQLERNARIR